MKETILAVLLALALISTVSADPVTTSGLGSTLRGSGYTVNDAGAFLSVTISLDSGARSQTLRIRKEPHRCQFTGKRTWQINTFVGTLTPSNELAVMRKCLQNTFNSFKGQPHLNQSFALIEGKILMIGGASTKATPQDLRHSLKMLAISADLIERIIQPQDQH